MKTAQSSPKYACSGGGYMTFIIFNRYLFLIGIFMLCGTGDKQFALSSYLSICSSFQKFEFGFL